MKKYIKIFFLLAHLPGGVMPTNTKGNIIKNLSYDNIILFKCGLTIGCT